LTAEPVHVFLGDLHAGSKLAPLVPFTTDKTQPPSTHKPENQTQVVLAGFLAQALDDARALCQGYAVRLHLGGDLVDGVAHHGTTQTVGDRNAQRDLAVKLLLPWVVFAGRDYCYGLMGTDAHVGDNGQEDSAVCSELGVRVKHFWRIESAGKLLDWAHHVNVGKRWAGLEGPLTNLANDTRAKYLEEGERPPDMIVRHHIHRYVRAHAKRTDVVAVPGWQSQTSFTRRIDPSGLLTVGVVLWWPVTGTIKPLLYRFPAEPIEKVPSASEAQAGAYA